MGQTTMIQTFVDDMLALKLIHSSGLTFKIDIFDPNQLFKLMHDVFESQASYQNITVKMP